MGHAACRRHHLYAVTVTTDVPYRASREAMRPFSVARHPAKVSLDSSSLRLSKVPKTNTSLSLHLVRDSFRPYISSFHRTFALSSRSFQQPTRRTGLDPHSEEKNKPSVSEKPQVVRAEKIWTIPNLLTISRILSCPALGYAILYDNFHVATGLLLYAGLTDLVRARSQRPFTGGCSSFFVFQLDGYLARRYDMGSVLGSILDPAADKALMTTLVVTLTVRGLVPCTYTRV